LSALAPRPAAVHLVHPEDAMSDPDAPSTITCSFQMINCTAYPMSTFTNTTGSVDWSTRDIPAQGIALFGAAITTVAGAVKSKLGVDLDGKTAMEILVASSDKASGFEFFASTGVPISEPNYVVASNPHGPIIGTKLEDILWNKWSGPNTSTYPIATVQEDGQTFGLALVSLDLLFPGNPDLANSLFAKIGPQWLDKDASFTLFAALLQAVALRGPTWMTQIWSHIATKPLSGICLPGTHDAGSSMVTKKTQGSSSCNTQTQAVAVYSQLLAGARYIDMRPSYSTELNDYFLTHFSIHLANWWGALGQSLQTALGDVANFCAQNAGGNEVIILNFSHMAELGTFGRSPLSQQQFSTIVDMVTAALGPYLLTSSNPAINLNQTPMQDLVATATQRGPCVIAVFAVQDETPKYAFPRNLISPASGIFAFGNTAPENPQYSVTPNLYLYDLYSKTPDFGTMLKLQQERFEAFTPGANSEGFLLSWTLTCDSIPCGGGSVLRQKNLSCISQFARYANPLLLPTIVRWINEGVIAADHIPNVLYLDYFGTYADNAVVLAAELSMLTPAPAP
jgi:hypothetical protein